MLDRIETANGLTDIAGVRIELIKRGTGRPLLLLHPAIGVKSADRAIEELARSFTVIAPSHPGFGRSELPRAMTTVDDLAYFYLDVMDALDLRDVVLAGCRSVDGSRRRSRSNRQSAFHTWCWPTQSGSSSATASSATSSIFSPPSRARSIGSPFTTPRSRPSTTHRSRMRTHTSCSATARRPRCSRGRPTCTTRSSPAVCTASKSLLWSSGARAIASCRPIMGAPTASSLPARNSN